eukprot:CAMPEP_0206252936 /NCGR_PEP_ID=MMETSP0047_2-20121206/22882_1 /ASSEMBLY_ACC=CAM_ASM_000192 /TAXON_ID=195065 /ORGANISM="Chroomonas mesostigmatica_cf, Strain CCMP1168" /LENGTH=170 /DNA_ID=CAMNT_0053679107 /DNA_START=504 /DNA_END=1016 /DNA_ORIENTATION=+
MHKTWSFPTHTLEQDCDQYQQTEEASDHTADYCSSHVRPWPFLFHGASGDDPRVIRVHHESPHANAQAHALQLGGDVLSRHCHENIHYDLVVHVQPRSDRSPSALTPHPLSNGHVRDRDARLRRGIPRNTARHRPNRHQVRVLVHAQELRHKHIDCRIELDCQDWAARLV